MSPLVVGESTTEKDGLLMRLVPHQTQDFEASRKLQKRYFAAQKKVIGTKNVTSKQKHHNYLNPQATAKVTFNKQSQLMVLPTSVRGV